ncbi:dicarboxylate/amino acid:cation symporter [Pasteurella atlantica]|uniref:dicarboxylate/amino acid:cation symporter n=1 Tax=Pasteurellaceae TaxID=712 RepID=UPI00277818FA|nr:dicarboxylate/amino acid:cation symporter [Pasteurella atlantica]MDP8098268.1 dicarboxylate/amino acid:cation symporter [Pasteurella atlantica]MDP8106546.1 dicarboxylate/amino acid:cation symporter [Pasteurella atlantica]MDP8116071.1 dicarboxylate/amino acid:cation symporter [Pasteurella atlantica]
MQKKSIFSWYFNSNLLIRILCGLILGGIVGILFSDNKDIIPYISPFGDVFIRLLKMIVLPVIVASLVVGAASIEPSRLGKIGIKILAFYILTSFFAIIVGLFFGQIFSPGEGLNLVGSADAVAKTTTAPTLVEVFTNMIPKNPFGAISNGKVLPTIIFCLFFGLSLAHCRESEQENIKKSAEVVYNFFEGVNEIIFKVVAWIMQYAPIGVFALIFTVFAKNGSAAFGPLLDVTGTVYAALITQGLVVYGVLAILFKLNPFKFFKRVIQPMVTAFVTRSSGGTLAVSMETAEHQMGIHRNVYGFTLPIGATINMDGTTIYLGVCAMFIANAVGIPLDFSAQATIIITAVLASIGTAGVPGAGAIMLIMVLESVGLKIEEGSAVAAAYAMIFGIDALLDMGRTSMNVVGDMLGTTVVAKSENEMDMSKWED